MQYSANQFYNGFNSTVYCVNNKYVQLLPWATQKINAETTTPQQVNGLHSLSHVEGVRVVLKAWLHSGHFIGWF